ncbi:MAG TPA: hypothetical protein VGR33_05920 [Actinomycetota bacterium]|jgi:hypothetical protein|nr:hypothetical protein [Actinomycetota bacterium]
MRPRFFATPSEFRAWLEKHHATAKELLVATLIDDSAHGRTIRSLTSSAKRR